MTDMEINKGSGAPTSPQVSEKLQNTFPCEEDIYLTMESRRFLARHIWALPHGAHSPLFYDREKKELVVGATLIGNTTVRGDPELVGWLENHSVSDYIESEWLAGYDEDDEPIYGYVEGPHLPWDKFEEEYYDEIIDTIAEKIGDEGWEVFLDEEADA